MSVRIVTHMKNIIFGLILFQFLSIQFATAKTPPSTMQVTKSMTSMPLAFTANNGQWDDKVKFRANAGGATMWFAPDGAYYQFTRTIASKPISLVDKRYGMPEDIFNREPDSIETMMIKAKFVGANNNPIMTGVDMMEYKCNYFIGNDPNEWHTDVPNYSAVMYKEIYNGIDLKYYGNGKQMEYDFIVSPGADYSQIKIEYEGAESIAVNSDGQLVVTTKWGEVIEQRPVIYQLDANNFKIAISGEYKIKGTSAFGFELVDYDASLPLVIDPVLEYSTYLGGSEDDQAYDIAVDSMGNTYITGSTVSSDFPINGELQIYQTFLDAFVTKINPSGSALVFSTYFGGNWQDVSRGIVLDQIGNIYIAGFTSSSDFPINREFQTYQGEGDGFVLKMHYLGNAIIFGTYLGGVGGDGCYGIALDTSGNIFVTGSTESFNFPILNEIHTYRTTGDAFVTKFNISGSNLIYSTYLGGNGVDRGRAIIVDDSGNAYVTGFTDSGNFPRVGEYQTHHDRSYDAFISKLNPQGDALVYSTFLGGSSNDIALSIDLDNLGSAYVTGYTYSTDFPTLNSFQDELAGERDVFVTKMNPAGNAPIYSTFIGGISREEANNIAIDNSGNAYITGSTYSSDFPSIGSYQSFQGEIDAFVTKLNSTGNSLIYSTYIGGSNEDFGLAIAVGDSNNAFVTGRTSSSNFPTLHEFQSFQGDDDVFVIKILSETLDTDSDGITDFFDNCLNTPNPDQIDNDIDGYGTECDCNDNDSIINPNTNWYIDSDGDGFGSPSASITQCDTLLGYVTNNLDCDDSDPEQKPNTIWYEDFDNDGFGNSSSSIISCSRPTGYILDANDNCPAIFNPSQLDSDNDGLGDVCDNCTCFVSGDFDGSEGVDIADLTATVNWMFKGGFAPNCLNVADVSSDCAVDIADLTYRIDFMFNGGPALICGCVE